MPPSPVVWMCTYRTLPDGRFDIFPTHTRVPTRTLQCQENPFATASACLTGTASSTIAAMITTTMPVRTRTAVMRLQHRCRYHALCGEVPVSSRPWWFPRFLISLRQRPRHLADAAERVAIQPGLTAASRRQPFGERFPDSPQRRQGHDDHSSEQTAGPLSAGPDHQARLGVLLSGPIAPKNPCLLMTELSLFGGGGR